MKTLHVLTQSGPCGNARELALLRPVGEKESPDTRICHTPWQRWLDPRPLWQLAASIREFQPDILVAWGLTALAAARLAAPKRQAALIVRKPFPPNRRRPSLSRFERWLLQQADGILVASQAEARRCESLGLQAGKLYLVRPGVRPLNVAKPAAIPGIVCAGELLPHKGFYEAIWAFDILQFARPHVQLAFAGDGPERGRLEDFRAKAGLRDRVQMLGQLPDIVAQLASASIVWVPSLTDTGAGVALEAMAMGLPVIASRVPALAEIVMDSETGFLVERGSQIELAQKTRLLVDDPALCQRLGEAGRRRALQHFSHTAFVQSWANGSQRRWTA